MNKVLAVARWEYLERVKSKAFIIGLILTPIIMVGMGVLPTLFATQEDSKTRSIGIIDRTGVIGEQFVKRMQDRFRLKDGTPNYAVLLIPSLDREASIATADRMVLAGQVDGYCIVEGISTKDSVFQFRCGRGSSCARRAGSCARARRPARRTGPGTRPRPR